MTQGSVIVSLIVDLLFSFNVEVDHDQTLFWVPKPVSIGSRTQVAYHRSQYASTGDTLTFQPPSFVLY